MMLFRGMRLQALMLLLLLTLGCSFAGEGQVVVSMRQYRLQGASRIHLYLYTMDGTFQKALTTDDAFNDLDPVFSYDGKSLQFTRVPAAKDRRATATKYIVDLASGEIRPADQDKDYFSGETCDQFSNSFSADSQGWINLDPGFFQSPDGRFALQRSGSSKEEGPCDFQIVPKGKEPVPIAGLPGFISTADSSIYDSPLICNGSPFVADRAGMALIFLSHHLGSTEGDEIWGLDLSTMKGARVSPNGAEVYHPPSAPGVFVVSQNRYQPLGNTGKTVNCSHLEWWDAHLQPVRYGPELSVCYSAAVYGGQDDTAVLIPSRN